MDEIVAVCTSHDAFHCLFGLPIDPATWTYPELLPIGEIGESIEVGSVFDGWGYVYGDRSMHEVAVDPQDAGLACSSYYSGGLRALQIECADPADTGTCELVEVGGHLDPAGNDFWGVETFVGDDGYTYVLPSDCDSGLWMFRDP